MPADPVAAGRKGGQSKSEAKRAAAKRNGFQPVRKTDAPAPTTTGDQIRWPVIVVPREPDATA